MGVRDRGHGRQGAAGGSAVAADVRRRAVYGTPGTPRPYLLLEELRAAYRSAVVEYSQERAVVGSVPPGGDRDHQSMGENFVKVYLTKLAYQVLTPSVFCLVAVC